MIKIQVLKHFPGARQAERGERKGDIREVATARRAMEKSRYVRVIEAKEVRRDDPIEYFLSMGVGSTL